MSKLSFDKAKEAAEALIDYVQRISKDDDDNTASSVSKKSLLLEDYADEDHTIPLLPFDLVVATKKIITDHKSMDPILVELPNQFFGKAASDALEPSVCLIVRDIKGMSAEAAQVFYDEHLVEATKTPEDALEALKAESPESTSATTAPKKKSKKSAAAAAASSSSSIPSLEDLSKIKIDRVVTFSQLRNEYKPFQARRKLISEHDLFFLDAALARADDGLLMPRVMGKSFYAQSKTVPQPVALTSTSDENVTKAEKVVQLAIRNKNSASSNKKNPTTFLTNSKTSLKDLAELVDADNIASTFSLTKTLTGMYKRIHGTHYMVSPSNQIIVRIGSTALTSDEVASNIEAAVATILETPTGAQTPEYLKGGWPIVRGVFLKTSTGPSLPIFVAETLYEDASQDVIADASEAVATQETQKDSAVVAKQRRIAANKLSDKRINQLLLDEIVDDESALKTAAAAAPADKKQKKINKETTPEDEQQDDEEPEKKKEPATPTTKKRREREGAPSPASVKKEVVEKPVIVVEDKKKASVKKTPVKKSVKKEEVEEEESTPATKNKNFFRVTEKNGKATATAAAPSSASKKKSVSFGKSK